LTVQTLVFAGENLSAGLVSRVRTAFPGVRVVNGYGQTESFYASAFALDPSDDLRPGAGSAPLGTPLANMRAYVLGPGLAMVPPGVVGELYVGGVIASGYHGRPGLTAERFVPDPFGPDVHGARSTGPGPGRWRDGRLEYAGRSDSSSSCGGSGSSP
jgi:non-ribosomal peptide synthetase component F